MKDAIQLSQDVFEVRCDICDEPFILEKGDRVHISVYEGEAHPICAKCFRAKEAEKN